MATPRSVRISVNGASGATLSTSVPAGTTDFSSFIADSKAKGAQLLAGQLASAGGGALWKQLKSLGFHPKAAFLAKASDANYWWQSLGSLAQDTLSESYWSPSQASPGQLAKITAHARQEVRR